MEEKRIHMGRPRTDTLFVLALITFTIGTSSLLLSLLLASPAFSDLLDALRWNISPQQHINDLKLFLFTVGGVFFALLFLLASKARARRSGHILLSLIVADVLLMVIAPVFLKSRDRHHHWTCSGNQRQLATATQMYLQDNDGKLPGNFADLLIYSGTEKILVCPDTLRRFHRRGGYGLNNLLRDKVEKDFPDPAFTLITADSVVPNGVLYSVKDVDLTRHSTQDRGRGFYVSYLDGHVQFILAKEAAKVQVGIALRKP